MSIACAIAWRTLRSESTGLPFPIPSTRWSSGRPPLTRDLGEAALLALDRDDVVPVRELGERLARGRRAAASISPLFERRDHRVRVVEEPEDDLVDRRPCPAPVVRVRLHRPELAALRLVERERARADRRSRRRTSSIAFASNFSQTCFGRMYTSIVGSFGSGTELAISTVRSSITFAVRFCDGGS